MIICPTSIALISHGQNTTIVDRPSSLVFGSLKSYWLHINRVNGILSLGDNGNRKPIFEYDFSDHFDDFFIDYFALAGSGHWIMQFLSGNHFCIKRALFCQKIVIYMTSVMNNLISQTIY